MVSKEKRPEAEKCVHFLRLTNSQPFPFWRRKNTRQPVTSIILLTAKYSFNIKLCYESTNSTHFRYLLTEKKLTGMLKSHAEFKYSLKLASAAVRNALMNFKNCHHILHSTSFLKLVLII